MQRSTIIQPISFESWLPAAQGKEHWQNEDTMMKMWWWISEHTLYWKLRQLHFRCHLYGYVKNTYSVRFRTRNNLKKWTLGNALASRLKMKKFKNDWGQLWSNVQSKLLFKCQMIVVTSDLTSYVMAPGHLISLYPFRLDRKTMKNIRLNYYPLFRKWAGALPQKDSSKGGTRPDPREQLIGAWQNIRVYFFFCLT